MVSGQINPLDTSLTKATTGTDAVQLSASVVTTNGSGAGTSPIHCTVIPAGFDAVGLILSSITISCVQVAVLPQLSWMLYVLVTVSGQDNPFDTSLTNVNVAALMVPPTELADPPAPVKAAKFAYAGCSVIEHTAVRFAGGVNVGKVFITVIVNVCGVPLQPFNVGVTVIVATTVVPGVPLSAVNDAILPVPAAANPIDGVLLVQLNVVPAVPLKVTADVIALAHKL
jgi:hypothetical protein